jgi:N-hydroxyarylamine O-acetyltransferase
LIDALLARLGLDRTATLPEVHRAYLAQVPYEDTAVQLGETAPLDEAALIARVLAGRGGYCFELNTVLAALLRACGHTVTHHEAVVGGDGPTNHMVLIVDGRWIADAGLGEGFLEPLPLRAGRHVQGPLSWTLEHSDSTWWLGQHEWGSVNGFRMAEPAVPVSAFDPHHHRLAHDPESSFVRTLVVQRPYADRIVTLRSRTLSVRGPTIDTKRVLDRAEWETFLPVLDPPRVERLWELACAQHEAFVAP